MMGIYKVTSPTKRVYIGQSIDVERRLNEYLNLRNYKSQVKLFRSINKYGVSNHKFEILEECKIEDLNERERYYQDYYNSMVTGLNCMLTKNNR